jgi:FkbM family methyltransferase
MSTPPRNLPPYGHYALTETQRRLLAFAQSRKANWLGRRLALLARRLVLSGRTQPIDAETEGFRLRVHVSDNISERKFLFMPRFCDVDERRYLVEHLTPGGVFLDIGANAGIYTLTVARAYAKLGAGTVLAVEANPIMQSRLAFNIGLNTLEAHVEIVPIALSSRDGEVAFSISNDNLGESGLLATGGRNIRVPCMTLASLLEAHGVERLDGMKIDVEGMEDVILSPYLAKADEAQLPRFIIIEDSTRRWHLDLLGEFAAKGYRVIARRKMNLILSRD